MQKRGLILIHPPKALGKPTKEDKAKAHVV